MKKLIGLIFLLVSSFTIYSQTKPIISIIPKPVKLEATKGVFEFKPQTKIMLSEQTEELQRLGDLITSAVNNLSGLNLSPASKMTHDIHNNLILIRLENNFAYEEGYSLEIKPDKITITAGSGSGVFYAIQSLLQLMPVKSSNKKFSVPCAVIEDYPRFNWRGVHLDVCRHFFPADFVKKYIDVLAMYKINKFHWHLTEDQGWRIEIKKYPELTEIGAWRKETMGDSKPYGGFYTQDQIKEIVEYAKERFITVVPEIEMPGHALAALTAYPELSCTGGPFEVGTKWGVYEDVYCAGNDKVFDFLEDVLTEVISLFPSGYIHIGGDECPKDRWKDCPKCQARIKSENLQDEFHLQSYFVQRIEKFLNSKGRKIIGWDEILEGGLAPNAGVMSWRGVDGGIAAAKAEHNVVMSPGTHCYFDHYQGLNNEPKAIGGYTSLEKIYSYEPVPGALTDAESKFIMGAQANVWTEYMETTDHVEYMLLPRLCALSEVVWSPKEAKDFVNFSSRMMKHYEILSHKNYNFRVPTPIDETGEYLLPKNKPIEFTKPVENSRIYYTLDGSEPTSKSKLYTVPLNISKPSLLKAKTILINGRSSPTVSMYLSVVDTTVNGLFYKYYEGSWSALPDFNSLSPLKSGKVYKLALSEFKPREDGFAVMVYGFISISNPGQYTFYLNSDDGSKLFLDNRELIDNDGAHGSKEMNAKIKLSSGNHPIKILYFERDGSQNLKLEYEGMGILRMPVPANAFFVK